MGQVQDKIAIVTGGASGIGAACADLLAREGAKVVLTDLDDDRGSAVSEDIRRAGGQAFYHHHDVTDEAGWPQVIEAAERWGKPEILVANAGVWNPEDLPIEKMTEKQWDDMIRINLKSVYSIIHFAVPQMIKQKSGKIIPISSTAGQRGESFHTHYGASKGGIISFTKGLATELARHNILVNCVAPGWVNTDMSIAVLETKAGQKMASTVIPLGRAATAEEIAGPILFVASDLANFMTGEIINVNGGSVLCG